MKSGLQHSSSVHLATFESTITKYLLCAIEVISDKVSRNKDYQVNVLNTCALQKVAIAKSDILFLVDWQSYKINNDGPKFSKLSHF